MTMDFLSEIMQAMRQQRKIFEGLKEKNFVSRILYAVKKSFRTKAEIKTLSDIPKMTYQNSPPAELHHKKWGKIISHGNLDP